MVTCMGGCGKDVDGGTPASNVNIDLDLTSSAYSKLTTKGNFVQTDGSGIIVTFSNDGNYYAANLSCHHEDGRIEFTPSTNQFHCLKHSKQFFSNKGVTNGAETGDDLKTYVCTLSGNKLNVKGVMVN